MKLINLSWDLQRFGVERVFYTVYKCCYEIEGQRFKRQVKNFSFCFSFQYNYCTGISATEICS